MFSLFLNDRCIRARRDVNEMITNYCMPSAYSRSWSDSVGQVKVQQCYVSKKMRSAGSVGFFFPDTYSEQGMPGCISLRLIFLFFKVVQAAWDTTFTHGLATTVSRHELHWKSLECVVEDFTLWSSIPSTKKFIQCGEYWRIGIVLYKTVAIKSEGSNIIMWSNIIRWSNIMMCALFFLQFIRRVK